MRREGFIEVRSAQPLVCGGAGWKFVDFAGVPLPSVTRRAEESSCEKGNTGAVGASSRFSGSGEFAGGFPQSAFLKKRVKNARSQYIGGSLGGFKTRWREARNLEGARSIQMNSFFSARQSVIFEESDS